MLGGFHFFVGSSLALGLTKNEPTALIIGILSHHLLDRSPHLDLNIFKKNELTSIKNWNKKIWLLTIIEFIFFIFLSFYFINKLDFNSWKIAFLGGIGGILPDLFTLFFKNFLPKMKFLDFYFNFHKKFHYQLKDKYFLPLTFQFLIFLLALVIYLGSI